METSRKCALSAAFCGILVMGISPAFPKPLEPVPLAAAQAHPWDGSEPGPLEPLEQLASPAPGLGAARRHPQLLAGFPPDFLAVPALPDLV